MQQPEGLLPAGMSKILTETEESPNHKIISLQDNLRTTQSALDIERSKNRDLSNQLSILRDNSKIKQDAVRYSKIFMVLVPLFCISMLIVSVTKGMSISLEGQKFDLQWDVQVKDYAQAAFVVAPVVFVATVLGFLLRGVFGTHTKEDEAGLSDLRKHFGSEG